MIVSCGKQSSKFFQLFCYFNFTLPEIVRINCRGSLNDFLGKRVRRQVQYFVPGQEDITAMDDDQEYQGDDGPHAGSDNEYQGATQFFEFEKNRFTVALFKTSRPTVVW